MCGNMKKLLWFCEVIYDCTINVIIAAFKCNFSCKSPGKRRCLVRVSIDKCLVGSVLVSGLCVFFG